MDLEIVASLCHGAHLSMGVVALFIAGLTGSAVHCGPMCGPLVLAQADAKLALVPGPRLCELTRIRGGLLLPYHLGRLLTYGALGAVAASIGSSLAKAPWLSALSGILLLVAAGLFLLQGLKRFIGPTGAAAGGHFTRAVTGAARRISGPGWANHILLGVLLGFLPCGLLYAALAVAAASPSPLNGALRMLAFGLGTMPMLIVIGIAGHAGLHRFGRLAEPVVPTIMLLNAALLLPLAWQALAR